METILNSCILPIWWCILAFSLRFFSPFPRIFSVRWFSWFHEDIFPGPYGKGRYRWKRMCCVLNCAQYSLGCNFHNFVHHLPQTLVFIDVNGFASHGDFVRKLPLLSLVDRSSIPIICFSVSSWHWTIEPSFCFLHLELSQFLLDVSHGCCQFRDCLVKVPRAAQKTILRRVPSK